MQRISTWDSRLISRLFLLLHTRSFRIQKCRRSIVSAVVFGASAVLAVIAAVNGQEGTTPFVPFIPNGTLFPNPGGASQTYSTVGGGIDQTGPFFQSLGTNGRSCGSCHQPSDGMSVSAANVQARFVLTEGLDPIFRTFDGSNCNHNVDASTLAGREAAYSLLRTRGLIRIPIAVPANADFRVVAVENQYGCDETNVISMYRRPPAAARHQPAFLERGHVRRTGINVAHWHNENPFWKLSGFAPQRSGAPVGIRDHRACTR